MSVYLVRGSDGQDGTNGHDGTTVAKAWATIGYAVTHVSAGDVIWVSPSGSPYRISATIAPSSMASMTYLYGDTDGSHTGDAGEVVVTNYATNDTTAPTDVALFTFASKNYWTLGRLTLVAGAANGVEVSASSAYLTFQDLSVWARYYGFSCSGNITVAQHITIERCRITAVLTAPVGFDHTVSATGSGDTDNGNVVRNCVLFGGFYGVYVSASDSTARRTGGLTVANNLIVGCYRGADVAANSSTTYPVAFYNNHILASSNGLLANAEGSIVEDYNVIVSGTTRTNISGANAGANSVTNRSRMWRFSLGHEASFGGTTRPFGEVPAGSPLLAWGTSGSVTVADDITGAPRPGSGNASVAKALGPFERSQVGVKESAVYPPGSTHSLRINGPGRHELPLVVKGGAAHTITVLVYRDGTHYAGTNPTTFMRGSIVYLLSKIYISLFFSSGIICVSLP